MLSAPLDSLGTSGFSRRLLILSLLNPDMLAELSRHAWILSAPLLSLAAQPGCVRLVLTASLDSLFCHPDALTAFPLRLWIFSASLHSVGTSGFLGASGFAGCLGILSAPQDSPVGATGCYCCDVLCIYFIILTVCRMMCDAIYSS
jgi:hypothetical protein